MSTPRSGREEGEGRGDEEEEEDEGPSPGGGDPSGSPAPSTSAVDSRNAAAAARINEGRAAAASSPLPPPLTSGNISQLPSMTSGPSSGSPAAALRRTTRSAGGGDSEDGGPAPHRPPKPGAGGLQSILAEAGRVAAAAALKRRSESGVPASAEPSSAEDRPNGVPGGGSPERRDAVVAASPWIQLGGGRSHGDAAAGKAQPKDRRSRLATMLASLEKQHAGIASAEPPALPPLSESSSGTHHRTPSAQQQPTRPATVGGRSGEGCPPSLAPTDATVAEVVEKVLNLLVDDVQLWHLMEL